VGDVPVKLYVFNPPNLKLDDQRSAVVFFFGGGWSGGSPGQFAQHCRYLASHGLVAITADYRVSSRQKGTKIVQCIADAKSAVRWVRANAEKLGIDPVRIAAGGGSAGGHLAACTGLLSGGDEPGEKTDVSAVPNAMILFNPALDLAPLTAIDPSLGARFGAEPQSLSPAQHVKPGAPPSIIFHGTADLGIPYASVKSFAEAMKKAGNRCELAGYEGLGHGFFNWDRNGGKQFVDTLEKTRQFLGSLGWLKGDPDVERFFKGQIR
jgi:acetyl esterase/lipase